MSPILKKIFSPDDLDFLKDESNLSGDEISEIVFPKTSQELSDYLKDNRNYFYVAGSQTGVVGGAVPFLVDDKIPSLISLSRNKEISKPYKKGEDLFIDVGSGVSLLELDSFLKEHQPDYFFPVDPTERSASFGGLAATNASGARSYHYSSVRKWIEALEVVLIDGTILSLERGRDRLQNLTLKLNGKELVLDEIDKPETKNSIGYFWKANCDLVDLFIGSEGTLGIISKLSLKLIRRPKNILTLLLFIKSAENALALVKSLEQGLKSQTLSIEFIDSNSFKIALESKSSLSTQVEAANSNGYHFGIFAEFIYEDESALEKLFENLNLLALEANENLENSICGLEDSEIEAIRHFRHAISEGINRKIAKLKLEMPFLRKIATDMAVPQNFLDEVYNLYSKTLTAAGLEHYIYGHVGNCHFHVNLVPKTKEEMDRALEFYQVFAKEIVRMGGAVSAEHGLGRIKKSFLNIQYSPEVLEAMREIKRFFDPEGRLSPGVLFN